MTQPLWTARWLTDADTVSAIEAVLETRTLAADIAVQPDGRQQLTIIMAEPLDRESFAALPLQPELSPLQAQDWLAVVARDTIQAGPFSIQPYRESSIATAETILIDGNYAFGDGHHTTTRGCIEAMIALRDIGCEPARIADIGCGTGVLAIVATKLWPHAAIVASDLDTAAVRATQAAASWNDAMIAVRTAAGFDNHAGQYDLILMNLLAGILVGLAPASAAHLTEQGCVITSGILAEQVDWVLATYRAHGLYEMARITQDGWVTMTLQRMTDAG